MSGKSTNTDSVNIMEYINANTIGAEIGVWKGGTSKLFLKRNPNKFYMVDPWAIEGYKAAVDDKDPTFSYDTYMQKYSKLTGGSTVEAFTKYYDKVYNKVVKEFEQYENAIICRMTSTEWFNSYNGEKLDWIYIDGDHSYTGVINDLNNCLKVMKPDGLIFGDDYKWNSKDDKGGVKKAVSEFAKTHNAKVEKISKQQFRIIL